MRIYLSCQQSPVKHRIPAYDFWEGYFKAGIEEAGYSWLESHGVDWAYGLIKKPEEKQSAWLGTTWSKVVSDIKREHEKKRVSFFLSYLFPEQIDIQAIKSIQQLGIPCVNFFCDNVREFRRIPDQFSVFNLHWVPEYQARKLYAKRGFSHIFAPMPVWIDPVRRKCDHVENYGVSFIGSTDRQRAALFKEAISLGLEPELRGRGWSGEVNYERPFTNLPDTKFVNQISFIKRNGLIAWCRKLADLNRKDISLSVFKDFVKAFPENEQYQKIIQESQIALGVNRYPSYHFPFRKPDSYSRLRDIEAPMLGACYLTEDAPGVDELYEIGSEIEIYRSAEELVEKVKELSADPERRRKLRRAGQARALSELSIPRTLSKILEALSS